MKKKRTYTVLAIIIAVLALGIGYAAATAINLSVNGNSTIYADFTFDVQYDAVGNFTKSTTNTFTKEGSSTATNAIDVGRTSDTVATVTFNFNKDNRDLYAILPIVNKSAELEATLALGTITQISGEQRGYFDDVVAALYSDAACTTPLGSTKLAKETGVAYLKVSQRIKKAPKNDIESQSWSVSFTATPVDEA